MTTVWRPRVRIPVPEVDDEVEVGVEVPEEVLLTVKGAKRKRAPAQKGAMRARGEVPLELQGVQRLSARSSALSVQGVRWVINLRARSYALSVQGVRWVQSASTVSRYMQECGGHTASTVVAHKCKECGGVGICEHGRQRSKCKECGGASICEHGRVRSKCKECGGGSICEHGRGASCKECGGSICEHVVGV